MYCLTVTNVQTNRHSIPMQRISRLEEVIARQNRELILLNKETKEKQKEILFLRSQLGVSIF